MPASGGFRQSPGLIPLETLRVGHAAESGSVAPPVTRWLGAALGVAPSGSSSSRIILRRESQPCAYIGRSRDAGEAHPDTWRDAVGWGTLFVGGPLQRGLGLAGG